MTRVFSGIQPTGTLHLGNYLGAIRNWVALQERSDFECIYCVVDYHAITVEYEPGDLPQQSLEMARDLLACGVDPDRSALFCQSQIPQHTELAWVFQATSTTYGELQRMTQFKAKADAQEVVTAGLFTYPVLQAADILLYDGERVPVGEDQVQHLELTREIARRFNNRFGDTFPDVQPLLTRSPKILSLKDPTQKMSKSAGPGHSLSLDGSEEEIRGMIKRAVTDVGPVPEGEMGSGVANLFTILLALEEDATHESLMKEYQAGTLKYVALKGAVSDAVWNKAAEIQSRKRETPPEMVREILRAGAERVRPKAESKMDEVRSKIGLVSL